MNNCWHWDLSIHTKDCPEKRLRFKLDTHKDIYEVDTLEDLVDIIKQDIKEISE